MTSFADDPRRLIVNSILPPLAIFVWRHKPEPILPMLKHISLPDPGSLEKLVQPYHSPPIDVKSNHRKIDNQDSLEIVLSPFEHTLSPREGLPRAKDSSLIHAMR